MISFSAVINKNKLIRLLSDTIKTSVEGNKFDVNGFNVQFALKDKVGLTFSGKCIEVELPVDLELSKASGLFSVSGHGSLMVVVKINYDINPGFQLTTKSEMAHHTWLTPAIVDVGTLDVPIEKVVEMMLKHYESVICGSIDKVIKENVDIRQQVDNALLVLKDNLNANAYFGLRLYVNPYEVLFEPVRDHENEIILKGAVQLDATVSDKNPYQSTQLSFIWADNILDDGINFINIDIDETIITAILCDYLNKMEYGGEKLQTKSCLVDFTEKHEMHLTIKIDKPIAGTILINAKPKYNNANETLTVVDLDVNVKPESFIYKLTAPLLSKFLASEVNNNLPIHLDKIIDAYTSSFKTKNVEINDVAISTRFDKLFIKELTFYEKGVKGISQINDLTLKVVY